MSPEELEVSLPPDDEFSAERHAEWHDIISDALIEQQGIANVVFVKREADWYLHGFYWLDASHPVWRGGGGVAPLRQRAAGAMWAVQGRVAETE